MATKTKPKGKTPLKQKLAPGAQFADQVAGEAMLRFGPQEQSLKTRLADAAAERARVISTAQTTAAGVDSSTRAADKALRGIYEPALAESHGAAAKIVGPEAQALPEGSALKAALSSEAAGQQGRLRGTLSDARAELVSRRTEAVDGAAYSERQANEGYAGAKSRIRSDQAALAGQEGAFAQGRSGQLVEAQRGRTHDTNKTNKTLAAAHREKGLDRGVKTSEGEKNRAAKEKLAADKLAADKSKGAKGALPGGHAPVTPTQQTALENDVASTRVVANRLITNKKGKQVGIDVIRQVLSSGLPAGISKKKYAKLIADGVAPAVARVQATTQAIPAQKNALAIEAALDLELYGHITPGTLKKLHDHGYGGKAVGPLGAEPGNSKIPASKV